ncbi:MAG: diguanylate cyclase [Thermotogota bacterium]|nr:diguanylate cyclase [Thermotogota bacterium]
MPNKKIETIIIYMFFLLLAVSIIILLSSLYDIGQVALILISSAFVVSPLLFRKDFRKYLVPVQAFALSTFVIHIFFKDNILNFWSILIYFGVLFLSLMWLVYINRKDVLEHRKTQNRLQKYSMVLEKVPFVIVIHDKDNIIFMNKEYKKLFGTKNILKGTFGQGNANNCKCYAKKDSDRAMARICRIDTLKGERWCSLRTELINGIDNYYITSVLDHTDQISSGEQIKELIDIEKRIFNSLPVGIAVISKEHGLEFSNEIFSKLVSEKRVPVKENKDICPVKCSAAECVLDRGTEYFEELKSKYGNAVYKLRCIPISKNGHVTEAAVTLEDITKKKKYIETLQNLSSSSNLIRRLSGLLTSGKTGFEEFGEEIYNVIHNELKLCDHMFIAKKISEEEILIEFGVIEGETVSGKKIKLNEPSLTGHIINNTNRLYLEDIKKSDIKSYVPKNIMSDNRPITFFGVPLKISGKTQGVVAFESWGEDVFDESKKEIFSIIASQLEVLIKIQKDVENLYEERNELKKIVVRDKLTGAYNRNFFDEYIKKIQAINLRQKENSSIVMLDINHFKKINDKKGHIFGDRVLKLVSEVIVSTLRDMDVFIRYGGDEFIIILPKIAKKDAYKVMSRITRVLETQSEKEINMKITISYGISRFGIAQDYFKAIKIADDLMYKMKNSNPET